jgi:hypothetical protein
VRPCKRTWLYGGRLFKSSTQWTSSGLASATYDRLIAPAYDYVPAFQTALLRLRLAVAGANLVSQDAHASFQSAAAQLLTQANAAGGPGMPTAGGTPKWLA